MDAKTRFAICVLLSSSVAWSADWYVDRENDGGTEDGTSWATAWGSLGDIAWASVNPGDTVYISGGVSTNKVYDLADYWVIEDGTSGNTNTYSIGQDEGHNGTAVFNYTGGVDKTFLWDLDYTIVTGDAGDGEHHFVLEGFTSVVQGNLENSIVEYVRATNDIKQAISCGGYNSSNFTFRHCDVKGNDLSAGSNLMAINYTGTPDWDLIIIEYCTMALPRSTITPGFGYDGIAGFNSTTFRYNTLTYFDAAYSGGQHADGWQSSSQNGGFKCRLIGNTIIGAPNYGIYVEIRYLPGLVDMEVYNNVVVLGFEETGAGTGGIIAGIGGGFPVGESATTALVQNVTIANNTIVDFDGPSAQPLNLASRVDITTTFTNCFLANNLVRSSNAVVTTGNTTSTITNNVTVTVANAGTFFSDYTAYSDSGDWSIVGAATPLIDTGYAMDSVFTTDITGLSRPSGSAWDIGAYEYNQNSLSDSLDPQGRPWKLWIGVP